MKKLKLMVFYLIVAAILLCACSVNELDGDVTTQVNDWLMADEASVDTKTTETTGVPESSVEKEIVELHIDRPVYYSKEEIAARAKWIVRGTVIDQRHEWRPIAPANPDSEEFIFTVTTLQIEEVYKGEIGYDTIEIQEIGGETETEICIYKAHADLEMNASYVVFLDTTVDNDYTGFLVGHGQGRYLVENDELKTKKDAEGISGFDITFAELNELKAKLSAEKEVVVMEMDRQIYSSQENLTDSADWIVRGTVISQEYGWKWDPLDEDADEKKLYTATYLQIEEIYKGEIPFTIIEILEEGGKTDTEFYTYDGYATFEKGSEYVVYLDVSWYNPFVSVLKGHNQGRYLVKDGELVADVDAQNVSGFDITFAELNELKAELMTEEAESE